MNRNSLLNKWPQRQLLKTDYIPNSSNLLSFTELFDWIWQIRWFWHDTQCKMCTRRRKLCWGGRKRNAENTFQTATWVKFLNRVRAWVTSIGRRVYSLKNCSVTNNRSDRIAVTNSVVEVIQRHVLLVVAVPDWQIKQLSSHIRSLKKSLPFQRYKQTLLTSY